MTEKMNVFGEVKEFKNLKTPAFGIDLGTTNSCISIIERGTVAKIIELENGKRTMPSCVMWKGKKGEFIVGEEAYKNRFKRSVIYSVKRMMGSDENVVLKYGHKKLEMTPSEVSAEILKELVRQASGQYKDINDVVITVPAYFNNKQVEDTIEAGRLAGLNVLGIMREPTAATLAYDLSSDNEGEEKVLVYDLGGGTFDTSLVRITRTTGLGELEDIYGSVGDESDNAKNTLYTVLDTDGDSHLGGDDIDRELYKILEEKLEDLGYDTSKIPNHEKEKLILRLENLKKRSDTGNYGVLVEFKLQDGEKISERVGIGPEDFQKAVRVVYEKTKIKVNSVLSKTDSSTISSIVLVGGSTKSTQLQKMLERDFPESHINNALNPDESVAMGAAIKAKEDKFGDTNVEVFDIIPLSIGIVSDGYVKPVIRKNQRVPYSDHRLFSTVQDNQERVRIDVYQGNSPIKEECLYLGTIVLDQLPKKEAGKVAVKVAMSVDSNGVLFCTVESEKGSKKVELVNLFGSSKSAKGSKILDSSEKRVMKWNSFAKKIGGDGEKEILSAVEKYKSGEFKVADVAKVISKYSKENTKVTKPALEVSDPKMWE